MKKYKIVEFKNGQFAIQMGLFMKLYYKAGPIAYDFEKNFWNINCDISKYDTFEECDKVLSEIYKVYNGKIVKK